MRVATIGGSGFLGRHVVHRLLACGFEIITLDMHPPRHQDYGERLITVDLTTPRATEAAARDCGVIDAVVWLAASISKSTNIDQDTIKGLRVMVEAPMRFLAALSSTPRSVVYISSIQVYGRPQYLPVDEEHPTEPYTAYGAAKLSAENYLRVWGGKNRVATTALRVAFIYGPGQHVENVIPCFLEAVRRGDPPTVYGSGQEVRDDVYVGDVAEAIHHAIAKSANGTFNIASGHPHTLWEIAEVIGRLTKPPLIPRSANIPGTIWVDRWFSTDRARRILECPEPTPFEKGVATMWDEMSR